MLTASERLELTKAVRDLPFVHTCPVGPGTVRSVGDLLRFVATYAEHAQDQVAALRAELLEARRAEIALRTLRQANTLIASILADLDARPAAAPATEERIFTGHDAHTDTDFLVTMWNNGTAEVATRPGNSERWITWGVPTPLVEESS